MILLKIAFRNLREHRGKTLIIGTLVALGVAVIIVGNSVLASVTDGLEASYVGNFTGDLIVRNASEEAVSFVGGGVGAPGFGAAPEPLHTYPDVAAYLDADPNVTAYTPLLSGVATVNRNDKTLSFALLWGIAPSSYFAMFPDSFVLTAGERLVDGQEGMMLSQEAVDAALEEGITLQVGDTVLLSGQNDVTGTKIREVTVRGVGAFKNSAGLLDNVSFVDVGTLRALIGLTAARTGSVAGSSAPTDLNEDALFGDGDTFLSEAGTGSSADPSTDSSLDFDTLLGDTSVRDRLLALDNDAWHFLLLDVADGALLSVERELSGAPVGQSLVVENWRWGAGFVAELAFGIRNLLNIVILVIAIVAVIIIMNTLVISVTERMVEIGTVRALGGQRGFVRRMITAEVLMTTLLFGVVGVAVGGAVVGVFNLVGLAAPNVFLQVLFGGSVLRPVLSVGSLFVSLASVAVVGVVASLYPVAVALGVSPVRAMQGR